MNERGDDHLKALAEFGSPITGKRLDFGVIAYGSLWFEIDALGHAKRAIDETHALAFVHGDVFEILSPPEIRAATEAHAAEYARELRLGTSRGEPEPV